MFRNWKTNAVKSDYLPLSQLNNGSTDALDHLPKDRQPRWSQRSTVATYLVVSGLLLVLIRGIYGQLSSELSQRKALGIGLSASELRDKVVAQSNAVLLIKTGASVAADRLPAHFEHELSGPTIPFQVYSDAPQDLQGHQLIDVLADIADSDELRQDDKFEPYRRQRTSLEHGQLPEAGDAFWDIDVYKNLPMAMAAVDRYPSSDFYIFADADTYVVQSNLLKYLATLNSSAHHYLGATTLINNIAFAHGGSGYVLSQGLARQAFVEQRESSLTSAVKRPSHECCGDFLLADTLYQTDGIDISRPAENSTLSFTGQLPEGIRYEERRLCAPVFSMHHVVEAETVSALWRFEQELLPRVGLREFITFAHLFQHFAHPALVRAIEQGSEPELLMAGWDNFSDEHEVDGVDDFAGCALVCDGEEDCIGWLFNDQRRCFWQPNMRIGQAASSRASLSGWRVDRFRDIWHQRDCR